MADPPQSLCTRGSAKKLDYPGHLPRLYTSTLFPISDSRGIPYWTVLRGSGEDDDDMQMAIALSLAESQGRAPPPEEDRTPSSGSPALSLPRLSSRGSTVSEGMPVWAVGRPGNGHRGIGAASENCGTWYWAGGGQGCAGGLVGVNMRNLHRVRLPSPVRKTSLGA